MEAKHFSQMANIYLEGIATGMATFQTEAPDWDEWDNNHLSNCRRAVFADEQMAGWAALSPVSGRCAYAGVAEVSIYMAAKYRGKGIGKLLLLDLTKQSEQAGFWTLQSGIFPNNIPSIRLHEQCGFRQIGYREKIGKKDGIWHDNIIMEKRSRLIGV